MTHRFPIKEIAAQAGLSTATVDRVINNRAHVAPRTRAQVAAALDELATQESQMSARGRRMFIDIVVEAPVRFSTEIRRAAEQILPSFGPAVIRPRFTFHEVMDEAQTLAILARIAKRGSQGICLKVRDRPAICAAVADLAKRGIPIVTLFTDLSCDAPMAYVGLDNARAGQTAAYLMAQVLGDAQGVVLTSQSQQDFTGEGDRAAAFAVAMSTACPHITLVDASGGGGLTIQTATAVTQAANHGQPIRGVYSMGGGNTAILRALDHLGQRPHIFVAHDLDADNIPLLRDAQIDFVLHHNITQDLRVAFSQIAAHHRLMRPEGAVTPSDIQIITPANMPKSAQF